ncbi:MAG: tetratricopeptide repeat protein [Candidatus Helarchaeota archaeon]
MYVCEQVGNNEAILKKTESYVKNVIGKYVDNVVEDIFTIPEKKMNSKTDLEKLEFQPVMRLIDDDYRERIKKSTEIQRITLNFLNLKMKEASDKGNDLEFEAIRILYIEQVTGINVDYMLFGSLSPYTGSIHLAHWKFLGIKYIVEKIKFVSLYGKAFQHPEIILTKFIPSDKLRSFINNQMVDYIIDKYGKPTLESAGVLNKFMNDFISIASVIWFNEKSIKQKEEIINDFYPFTFNRDLLNNIYKTDKDLNGLSALNSFLYKNRYLEESLLLSKFFLEKSINDLQKFEGYDNIATAYRDLGDYKNALIYYFEELNTLMNMDEELLQKEADRPEDIDKLAKIFGGVYKRIKYDPKKKEMKEYQILISIKNIAEVYFNLGNVIKAEKLYKIILDSISQFSDKGQVAILNNLAASFRRIRDFEREYKFLSKMLEYNEDVLGPRLENIYNRLSILNDAIDPYNGKLDTDSLKSLEDEFKFKEILNKSFRLLNSFQFEEAIKWFEKAYQISKDSRILIDIGFAYFLKGDLDPALKYFNLINELNKKEIKGYFYPGIIKIIKGKIDEGVEDVARAIELMIDDKGNFHLLLRDFLKQLIKNNQLKSMDLIIDRLSGRIANNYQKGEFYNDIAVGLTELGFFDEGIKNFNISLKSTDSNILNINLEIDRLN